MITAYNSKHQDAGALRNLASLAAHTEATQKQYYEFSRRTQDMVETRLKLDALAMDPLSVQRWVE